MNNSQEKFEIELGRMVPADTSRELRSLIAEELKTAKASRRRAPGSHWSLLTAWGLTAGSVCVTAALLLRDAIGQPTSVPVGPDQPATISRVAPADDLRMIPFNTSGVLLVALDEGVVYMDTGEAFRKVRLRYVDTLRLRDLEARAAVEITYPREEVRYVPVVTF